MPAYKLNEHPIHLGLGATSVTQPEFSGGMQWYEGYGQRHSNDGAEGRLVSMHTFSESWDSWEMHPRGTEVVLCTSGAITMHQEHPDGTVTEATITAGEYLVNEPGVWHTADVAASATAVFITAGLGTEHRPR